MLHFDRDAVRAPHLVVIDGGRAAAPGHAGRPQLAVVLVLVATVLAIVVDAVDRVPLWSPLAVCASAAVLAIHTRLRR